MYCPPSDSTSISGLQAYDDGHCGSARKQHSASALLLIIPAGYVVRRACEHHAVRGIALQSNMLAAAPSRTQDGRAMLERRSSPRLACPPHTLTPNSSPSLTIATLALSVLLPPNLHHHLYYRRFTSYRVAEIEERQQMIAVLGEHAAVASEFQAAIGKVPDLQRLLVKSVTLLKRFHPCALAPGLSCSYQCALNVLVILQGIDNIALTSVMTQLTAFRALATVCTCCTWLLCGMGPTYSGRQRRWLHAKACVSPPPAPCGSVPARRRDATDATADMGYQSDDDAAGDVVTEPGGSSGSRSDGSTVAVTAADVAALAAFCDGALT